MKSGYYSWDELQHCIDGSLPLNEPSLIQSQKSRGSPSYAIVENTLSFLQRIFLLQKGALRLIWGIDTQDTNKELLY
ncbi:hypothetical protein J6590_044404 [Homalodisca vitripennis]|nr:hypothetical protein J6590_044404 [Homalodisca vitripennis]